MMTTAQNPAPQARTMAPTFFISAGEASGEHYGAMLIDELKKQLADTGQSGQPSQSDQFFGMGGERMVAAGLDRVVRSEDMAVMGITEVVRHLPRIYREFRKLKKSIQTRRPDVAVLIDFPDIHFKLAEELHRLGVPVIFFVSPQLWAWKKHRIKLVRKYVDKMLVIFPFEEQFYLKRGVTAEFVGHPLAELPLPSITRKQFAAQSNLDPARTWIGILPGSRPKEIRDNLPEMLKAAQILSQRDKSAGLEFLIPLAPTLNAAQREQVRGLVEIHGAGINVHLVEDAPAALFHSRASIVASGTATVEAALIGNPFVVVYRVSPLTYAIAKRVVKVPHVAMANLIAGKRMVPELIQDDFTAANIVQQLEGLLPDGVGRESMMRELKVIRDLLNARTAGLERGGAIERVAAITLDQLEAISPKRTSQPVQS
ncbi:MAG: lipid-A-disaccharide synthase [Terracidiphilus sp.]|jgi:lipid-A-disaccharide synthase